MQETGVWSAEENRDSLFFTMAFYLLLVYRVVGQEFSNEPAEPEREIEAIGTLTPVGRRLSGPTKVYAGTGCIVEPFGWYSSSPQRYPLWSRQPSWWPASRLETLRTRSARLIRHYLLVDQYSILTFYPCLHTVNIDYR